MLYDKNNLLVYGACRILAVDHKFLFRNNFTKHESITG